MKTLMTAAMAAVIVGTGLVRAEEPPQEVPSAINDWRSHDWYVQQAKLWKHEVEREPANAAAWLNYYKASRYMGFGDSSAPAVREERLAEIVERMTRAVPNTFESHLVIWWNGGNDPSLFNHLRKAYELRQDYGELSDDFISYHLLQGNTEQVEFFCRKWYQSRSMAPGLLEYHYNVLTSLKPNALLITSGDIDTYPILLLQHARGIRPDVTVLNTGLISDSAYRHRLMEGHNIAGDPSILDHGKMGDRPFVAAMGEFLESLAKQNSNRPVYVSLTAQPVFLSPIRQDLYTVGLANLYSPERIDNIAMLKRNWENFRLDYLNLDFYNEGYLFNERQLPSLHMNYIMPAVMLYEHYRLAGDDRQAEQFRQFALDVAQKGGKEEELLEYLREMERER